MHKIIRDSFVSNESSSNILTNIYLSVFLNNFTAYVTGTFRILEQAAHKPLYILKRCPHFKIAFHVLQNEQKSKYFINNVQQIARDWLLFATYLQLLFRAGIPEFFLVF